MVQVIYKIFSQIIITSNKNIQCLGRLRSQYLYMPQSAKHKLPTVISEAKYIYFIVYSTLVRLNRRKKTPYYNPLK